MSSELVCRQLRAVRAAPASAMRLAHIAAFGLIASASCGGDTTTTPPPPPAPTVSAVTVTPATADVAPGASVDLTASIGMSDGSTATGRTPAWSSSAPGIASVSATGRVTGVAAGSASITATVDGKSGSATVNVVPVVASVAIAVDTASLDIGGSVQLTAVAKDAQGAPIAGRTVGWSSTLPAVAAVSSSGRVTAVGVGRTLVIASLDGKRDTATISVRPAPLVLAVESARATTRLVGTGGDTLRAIAADGTIYTLAIPVSALRAPVQITMAPITGATGLPLAGGFAAGVDFQPSGLVFARAATLTIATTKAPSGENRLVGLSYEGTGQALHLAPARKGSNTITMSVSHFSGAIAGFGTAQDIEALWLGSNPPRRSPTSTFYTNELINASVASPRDAAFELQILEDWFDDLVFPSLDSASTDVQLLTGIANYEDWIATMENILDVLTVIPGGRNAPSLVSRRAQWFMRFFPQVKNAILGNQGLCAAPGLASGRITALDNAIFWYRYAAVNYGPQAVQAGITLAFFQNGSCARVVADSLTLSDPLNAKASNQLEVTFKLVFAGGQLIVPANFYVTSSATGAALSLPVRTAATPAGYLTGTVTPTGSSGAAAVDLEACYAGGLLSSGILNATLQEVCGIEHIGRQTLDVSGAYTGTFSSTITAPGGIVLPINVPINVNLTQVQNGVSGTYDVRNWSGPRGTVSAILSGPQLLGFTLSQLSPCPGQFNGTASINVNTRTITAAYTGSDCSGTHANGISVVRPGTNTTLNYSGAWGLTSAVGTEVWKIRQSGTQLFFSYSLDGACKAFFQESNPFFGEVLGPTFSSGDQAYAGAVVSWQESAIKPSGARISLSFAPGQGVREFDRLASPPGGCNP